MPRYLLLLPALLLVLVVGPARAERVQIEYWEKWTGEEGDAMRAIVDEFNASQDRIHVNLTIVSQIDQKLLLSVLGKSPPDVAGLWAPFVASYAERGLISPLDPLIASTDYPIDAIMPSILELCLHRGTVWALPSSSMCLMLYVNEAILLESGLDPSALPETVDELMDMSERLTRVEVVRDGISQTIGFTELTDAERAARDYEIVRLGFDPTVAQPWLPYLDQWFGGGVVADDGSIDYDDPGLIAALRWYRDFFETYGVDRVRRFGSAYGGAGSAGNPFFNGRVAMVLNGPWLPRFIDEFAPTLDYGVGPMPRTDASPADAYPTLLDSDILVIPRGAAHPEEAFEFIAYATRPDVVERLNLAQSKLSPLAIRSEAFLAEHPNPAIALFYDAASGPAAFPVHSSVMFSRLVSDLFTALDLASTSMPRARAFLDRADPVINRKVGYANDKWARRGDAFEQLGNLR